MAIVSPHTTDLPHPVPTPAFPIQLLQVNRRMRTSLDFFLLHPHYFFHLIHQVLQIYLQNISQPFHSPQPQLLDSKWSIVLRISQLPHLWTVVVYWHDGMCTINHPLLGVPEHFSCLPVKSAQSQHGSPRQLPGHLTAVPLVHASPTLTHNLKDFIRNNPSLSPAFSHASWYVVYSQVLPHAQENSALLDLTCCHFLSSGCSYHRGYLLFLCARCFPDTNACPVCLQHSVLSYRLPFLIF